MATYRKEISIEASAEQVWDAVREVIVTIDDESRRLAYAAVGSSATHHNSSVEVFDEGKTRLVWTTDVLPADLLPYIVQQVEAGSAVMKRTLEGLGQGL